MRRIVAAAFAVCALLGALPTVSASAMTERQSQIESEKAALRQKIREADAQARSLTQQIADSDAKRADLEKQILGLSMQLQVAESDLESAEAALGIARTNLLSIEGSLASSLGRLEDMRTEIQLRARDTYKLGPSQYARWLFSSSSLREFITRVSFMKTVMTEDNSRVRAVQTLTQQLSTARGEAVEVKASVEQQKADIEARKARVIELRDAVRNARAGVIAELARRQTLLKKVQSDKAEYLRQMSRLEAESRSIAAMLRARQRGQVFQAGSGVHLAWPTTGSVSSGFGYRIHPIFGDRRLHTGIDISAPYGQQVVVADSGQVVYAGQKGGYGLVVIIDHGNALATLYAHLSATSVATGTSVSRGARIASVGCSGYCTGPHLHFETRVNGEPRDPMLFF